MKNITVCFLLVFSGLLLSCNTRQVLPVTRVVKVQKMFGTPDAEPGFALGVSASYGGVVGDWLLLAGGCNFPELPLTQGGEKRYYKGIYVANKTSDSILVWRKVGELPVAAAYGVSMPVPGGVVIAGGMNEEGALSSVYRLRMDEQNQMITLDTLPSLPVAIDNMGGVSVKNELFVIGGNVHGKPSQTLYSLSLNQPNARWVRQPDFPGEARIQPTCAAQPSKEGNLYLWGGFAPSVNGSSATLSTNGYCYSLADRTWTPLDSPVGTDSIPVSLGGGGAVTLNDSLIACVGGVNKDIFLEALKRGEALYTAKQSNATQDVAQYRSADSLYLTHTSSWYRFNNKILVYNTYAKQWSELLQSPFAARAGATVVSSNDTLFVLCGELKPGIRTSEISRFVFGSEEEKN